MLKCVGVVGEAESDPVKQRQELITTKGLNPENQLHQNWSQSNYHFKNYEGKFNIVLVRVDNYC